MQIFVRSLAGQSVPVTVEPGLTVAGLKAKIAAAQGIEVEEQRLVYAGEQLEDTAELLALLQEDATVHLSLSLLGGGKKRKKKVYTKPKKIKHKKKKVKLAILKCYRVDDDGKVTRLRRESPHNPGSFMATHFDRQTCGKTGLTYMFTDKNKKKE